MIPWNIVGSSALDLLKLLWKPLVIAAGGVFIVHLIWYGPRMDNMELELELAEKDVARMERLIESQNDAIENASKVSQSTFNDMLSRLDDTLNQDNNRTNELIEAILAQGIPEGCTESTMFLLEQIENLQWETP